MFMYCIHCGKQLDSDVRFCPRCGKKSENIIPNFGNTFVQNQVGSITFNHATGKNGGSAFLIILLLIMDGVYIWLISFDEIWKHYKNDEGNYIKFIFIFMIIINFIPIILNIAKISAISQTSLTLTPDRVQGMGGTPSYFGNVSIDVLYNDIITVNIESGALIINTNIQSYKLFLDNAQGAATEILRRKQMYK